MNNYIKNIYTIYLKYIELVPDINTSRNDIGWVSRGLRNIKGLSTFRLYISAYTGSQINQFMKDNKIKII